MDRFEQRIGGGGKLFIASVYHPVDENFYNELNNILSIILSSIPKLAEFIGGYDINTNVGKRKKMYRKIMGSLGIDHKNKEGKRLLGLFLTNHLKFINSFLNKLSYTTWRSFNSLQSPHMLHIISTSSSFFKHVNDCKVPPLGVRSNHSAFKMIFLNKSITFKTIIEERPRKMLRLTEILI